MTFLVELPLLLLVLPTSVVGIGVTTALYITVCCFMTRLCVKHESYPFDIADLIVSAAVSLVLGVMFFSRWMPSGTVAGVASILHLTTAQLVGFAAGVLSLTAIYGVYILMSALKQLAEKVFCKNPAVSDFNLFEFLDKRLNIILCVYMVAVSLSIVYFKFAGDDLKFHMQRMDAIMQEFSNLGLSALPLRLYHSTAYGYGYASPMFYSDVFMWPFAAIGVLLNTSVLTAYKLMHVSVFIVTWLMAKYSFRLVFDGHKKDLAVFLYVVSVAVFENVAGDTVGRALACMFVPLCFCSFYCIMYGDREKQLKYCLLLALGVAGLLFSNLNDAVIVVFSLLVLLLFVVKKLTLKKLVTISASALICLGLTAWFLLPMLEQMSYQTLFVTSTQVTEQINDLSEWTMPLVGILLPANVRLYLCSSFGIGKDISPYSYYFYGMLFYIVLICILIWKRREVFYKNSGNREFFFASVCLLAFYMIFQTSLFPHKALNGIIGTIQFPWRVNTVMTCLACLLTVKLLTETNNKNITSALVLISLILVLAVGCANYGLDAKNSTDYSEDSEKYVYYTHSVGAGEYMPVELLEGIDRKAWKETVCNRGTVVICDDENVVYSFDKTFDSIILSYSGNTDGAVFELPLISYKGYTAVDADSGESCVVGKSENGFVTIKTDKEFGKVKVFYEGTVIQTVSEWISAVSAVTVLAVIAVKKKRGCSL